MNLRDKSEVNIFIDELNYFINNTDDELKKIQADIDNTENERDDLLHEIELSNLNAIELSRTSKRLRETLQKRRQFKEQREFIRILRNYTNKLIQKGFAFETNQLVESIANLEKIQNERKYTPRILTDLKIGKNEKREE